MSNGIEPQQLVRRSPVAHSGDLESRFVTRQRRVVRLGPLSVDIRSNEAHFSSLRYFPASTHADESARPDYTLSFCNLDVDGPWPMQALMGEQDTHYRAVRFAAGYYIGDHFGAPAHIITRGTHYWFFGVDFEPILWPYVAKLLLTLHAMKRGLLHLKSAAVAVDGAGTLLVARGGGGKTVLLTRLCQQGAQFLSNTHTLIDDGTMIAVPTAMRVRNDALFGPMIAARGLSAGLKPGEYVADPLVDLGWQGRASAPVRNICLVEYRGPAHREIREMDRQMLFDYMEQFSSAINVYGLKEDVLDSLGGDLGAFSARTGEMRARLRALVDRCNGYYVSCDWTDSGNLEALRQLLAR